MVVESLEDSNTTSWQEDAKAHAWLETLPNSELLSWNAQQHLNRLDELFLSIGDEVSHISTTSIISNPDTYHFRLEQARMKVHAL